MWLGYFFSLRLGYYFCIVKWDIFFNVILNRFVVEWSLIDFCYSWKWYVIIYRGIGGYGWINVWWY